MLLEITLRADEAVAEALADALLKVGALSVAIEDADAELLHGDGKRAVDPLEPQSPPR